MKKLILLSILSLATLFAFAQKGNGDPEARIQKKVDHLSDKLSLSKDQQIEVKNLIIAQHETRKKPAQNWSELSEEEKEDLKAARKDARERFDTEMATILNADQNRIYKEMPKGKGKKRAHHAKRMNDPERAEKKLAKMTEALDLTPQQQKQMKVLMMSKKSKVKRDDVNWKELSDEEKAKMKEEFKANHQAYKDGVAEILTPEQLEKFQQMKEERKGKRKKQHTNDLKN